MDCICTTLLIVVIHLTNYIDLCVGVSRDYDNNANEFLGDAQLIHPDLHSLGNDPKEIFSDKQEMCLDDFLTKGKLYLVKRDLVRDWLTLRAWKDPSIRFGYFLGSESMGKYLNNYLKGLHAHFTHEASLMGETKNEVYLRGDSKFPITRWLKGAQKKTKPEPDEFIPDEPLSFRQNLTEISNKDKRDKHKIQPKEINLVQFTTIVAIFYITGNNAEENFNQIYDYGQELMLFGTMKAIDPSDLFSQSVRDEIRMNNKVLPPTPYHGALYLSRAHLYQFVYRLGIYNIPFSEIKGVIQFIEGVVGEVATFLSKFPQLTYIQEIYPSPTLEQIKRCIRHDILTEVMEEYGSVDPDYALIAEEYMDGEKFLSLYNPLGKALAYCSKDRRPFNWRDAVTWDRYDGPGLDVDVEKSLAYEEPWIEFVLWEDENNDIKVDIWMLCNKLKNDEVDTSANPDTCGFEMTSIIIYCNGDQSRSTPVELIKRLKRKGFGEGTKQQRVLEWGNPDFWILVGYLSDVYIGDPEHPFYRLNKEYEDMVTKSKLAEKDSYDVPTTPNFLQRPQQQQAATTKMLPVENLYSPPDEKSKRKEAPSRIAGNRAELIKTQKPTPRREDDRIVTKTTLSQSKRPDDPVKAPSTKALTDRNEDNKKAMNKWNDSNTKIVAAAGTAAAVITIITFGVIFAILKAKHKKRRPLQAMDLVVFKWKGKHIECTIDITEAVNRNERAKCSNLSVKLGLNYNEIIISYRESRMLFCNVSSFSEFVRYKKKIPLQSEEVVTLPAEYIPFDSVIGKAEVYMKDQQPFLSKPRIQIQFKQRERVSDSRSESSYTDDTSSISMA